MISHQKGAVVNQPTIGFRSRLKYVVDNLTVELGHGIQQFDIAQRAGISRVTLSAWMKPYVVMGKLDLATLNSLIQAVKDIASEEGVTLKLAPEDIIEFVGFPDSSNKIERLSVGLAG